jgi:hypothetical protein
MLCVSYSQYDPESQLLLLKPGKLMGWQRGPLPDASLLDYCFSNLS